MIDSSLAVNVIYPIVGKEGLRVGPLNTPGVATLLWYNITVYARAAFLLDRNKHSSVDLSHVD